MAGLIDAVRGWIARRRYDALTLIMQASAWTMGEANTLHDWARRARDDERPS